MTLLSLSIVRYLILLTWLVLCCLFLMLSVNDVFSNVDTNKCHMTYMYELPDYVKLSLKKEIKQKYSRYGVFLYGEGSHGHTSRRVKVHGIPVLFIPGHLGSHKQVRSLASVALRRAQDGLYRNHFDYFTVDLGESFSGVYGGELWDQTNFVSHCIRHILHLYEKVKHKPSSVILVGHSMGGMIARALFSLDNFNPSQVNTIITVGTPHVSPVLAVDRYTSNFYHKVNSYWVIKVKDKKSELRNVTVASVAGGYRDVTVPSHLVALSGLVPPSRGVSAVTDAIPRVWLQVDHQCLCWCKELVQVINRALFEMINPSTRQITTDANTRGKILHHHFVSNSGISVAQRRNTAEDILSGNHIEVVEDRTWSLPSCAGMVYIFPIRVSKADSFVALTDHLYGSWIYACKEEECITKKDLSDSGELMPSTNGNIRTLTIKLNKLRTYTHIAIRTPSLAAAEFFSSALSSQLSLVSDFMFSNISLDSYTSSWLVHEIKIKLEDCSSPNVFLAARLYSPWFDQHTYIKSASKLTIPIKLHRMAPRGSGIPPQLHIWTTPGCRYSLSFEENFEQSLGQLLRIFAIYIPNMVFSISFIFLTRQASLWQQSSQNSFMSVLFSDKWFFINMVFLFLILTFFSGSNVGYEWLPIFMSLSLSLFFIVAFYLQYKVISFVFQFFFKWGSKEGVHIDNRRINVVGFSIILVFMLMMSFTTCSGVAIFIALFVFFGMLVKEGDCIRVLAKMHCDKPSDKNIELMLQVRRNNHHFKETIFILLCLVSLFCLPSMVVWAKMVQKAAVLKVDPFGVFMPLLCINVACLVFFPVLHFAPKHLSYLSTLIAYASIRVLPLQNLAFFLAFFLTVKNITIFLENRSLHEKKD